MPKISLAAVGAKLGAETLDFTEDDFNSRISNLPALAAKPELARSLLEQTRVHFYSAHMWQEIGAQLREVYTEGELNAPATKVALRNFLFLALPERDKDDYYYNPPRKVKGEEESPAVKEMKKRKVRAQQRLSKVLATVLEAAYPPQRVPKPDAIKKKEQEEARKLLAGEGAAAADGKEEAEEEEEDSRPESRPESRYSDASAMDADGDEEEEEDDDETGGIATLAAKIAAAAGGAGSVAKPAESKGKAAAVSSAKPVALGSVEEYKSMVRHLHAQATELGFQHCLAVSRETKPDGIVYVNVPEGTHVQTTTFITNITTAFKADGSLTRI
jgi:hypothetical protein